MAQARVPRTSTVFLDRRGDDRSLRVTWHQESQLVVLSLWRDNVCAGTFRLGPDEVPELIALLRRGLDDAHDAARERVERSQHAG